MSAIAAFSLATTSGRVAAAALQEKLDACFAAGVKPLSKERSRLLMERVQNIEAVSDMSAFFAGIM